MSVANDETLLAKGLRVLGDKLSLAMLRLLVNGPMACAELEKKFQCSHAAAWRRLEDLREAGFIQRLARKGKTGRALYVACIEKIRAHFALTMSYTGIAQGDTV